MCLLFVFSLLVVVYRECATDGVGYTKDGCLVEGKTLKGFPTWVIGGRKVEGEGDLEELEGILDKIEKLSCNLSKSAEYTYK